MNNEDGENTVKAKYVYPKPIIDLHTHTIASGHAYSTLKENIEEAIAAGLKVLGTSEHARMMPGTACPMYFKNFKVIPKEFGGVRLFNGIEANIYDEQGHIDVENDILSRLDYVIASMHIHCIKNMGIVKNTNALIAALENPAINVIGHPDDSRFPIDEDTLAAAAAQNHKALEFNNSSLHPRSARRNGPQNVRKLLSACRKYGTMVLMGTDSHICWEVGHFDRSIAVLEELQFPPEQIINFDISRLGYVIPALRKTEQKA